MPVDGLVTPAATATFEGTSGPSLLRFSTNYCQDEELEQIKDTTLIAHDYPDAMVHIRTSSSKDTLNTKSSVQTSVFSSLTSAASISSYQISRPQSAQTEHSRLVDALALEIYGHKCNADCDNCSINSRNSPVVSVPSSIKNDQRCLVGTVHGRKRIYSLPTPTTQGWSGELQVKEIAHPYVSLLTSAEHLGRVSPEISVSTSDVPQVREEIVEIDDDFSTTSDDVGAAKD